MICIQMINDDNYVADLCENEQHIHVKMKCRQQGKWTNEKLTMFEMETDMWENESLKW